MVRGENQQVIFCAEFHYFGANQRTVHEIEWAFNDVFLRSRNCHRTVGLLNQAAIGDGRVQQKIAGDEKLFAAGAHRRAQRLVAGGQISQRLTKCGDIERTRKPQ